MLIFYGFGSAFGLPDPSPFVMKSEVQLKMADVPYRFERAAPPSAPKGKIPFIQVGAHRVGDSTFIRAHIEKAHGFDFDKGLSAEQRAQAWAIERMLEDHLYFAILQTRWLDDDNWTKGPSHFFDGAPEGVAAGARERTRLKRLTVTVSDVTATTKSRSWAVARSTHWQHCSATRTICLATRPVAQMRRRSRSLPEC